MSLHFISGKPGGGKSYYAVKLLVDELRLSKRDIATNLPLNLGNLAEHLHSKYGQTFDMNTRLRMLTQEEAAEFWLHPCNGVDLTERTKVQVREKSVSQVDYSKRPPTGTVFFIDEVHIYFNARGWQNTGEDCIFYISQHRKLGDDIIAITQHVGNVDKQFRTMTQDYTYLRNLNKERMGIFRSFPVVMRSTYAEPYTGQQKAQETGAFRLDVTGLCTCYETNAGVGVHSRSDGDKTERRRGIPIVWMIAGIVLIGIFAMFVPHLMGKGVTTLFSPGKPKVEPKIESKGYDGVTAPRPAPVMESRPAPLVAVPQVSTNTPPPPSPIVAATVLGGAWNVWLANGSRYTQGADDGMTALSKRGAQIDGILHPWKIPAPLGADYRELPVPKYSVPQYDYTRPTRVQLSRQ
ncbi:zona occludens toxin [Gammaproteobacteria bacterium]